MVVRCLILSRLDTLQLKRDRLDGPLMTRMMFWLCKGRETSRNNYRSRHMSCHRRPEWTELPNFDVFGSFPVVTDGSSWLCCSPSLTSTSLPGLTPVALFPPCILASSKLCILGLGTWTFPEVTVFDVVCFF